MIKIDELFQELFRNLSENSHQSSSLSIIFLQLNDIYQSLTANNYKKISFDIFELIFQNYLKLLDIDLFVEIIIDQNYTENNEFLRKYFSITWYEINYVQARRTARDVYFLFFDQLASSRRILSYLQNDLSNDNPILRNICAFILYTILKLLNDLHFIVTNKDLAKHQNNLFNSFIQFLDQYFTRKESSRQREILIEQIRRFLSKLSHFTPTIPIFINIHCPQSCLRWLSIPYLDIFEYEFFLVMLYNTAHHDEGVSLLNQSNCAKIVRQFQANEMNKRTDYIINQEMRWRMYRILDLIVASTVDLDTLYLDEDRTGTIKRVLVLCKTVFEHPAHPYEYKTSDLLIILMKLCTNDQIVDYMLQQDQCPKLLLVARKKLPSEIEKNFFGFLESYGDLNILTMTALANIFWSISFDDRYKSFLIQNINFIKRLENFRENSSINNSKSFIHIPYQMSSLRRTIEGIWQNLYPKKLEIKPTTKTTCSIMISYSQVNIHFCRELFEMLSKLPELSIHVDFKNGKYSWNETAEMIEQANVVLFLLSKEFYYTKSCRQEFIYATDTLKKLFFPIFIDQEFKPSGWLHKPVTRLKSIRFGEKDFLTTCEELLSLINENLSMNISLINNSSNVANWNDKEIKQWFINHRIRSELYEFYHFQNGQELLLYAKATLAFPWMKEYERIKVRFEEKFQEQEQSLTQEQFLQFIYALKRLSR